MKRILVISGDILPYPGLPTTGAGLRAWGLAKGLESKGHDVLVAMPQAALRNFPGVPEACRPFLYKHAELPAFIARHAPDVVVLQHWLLAGHLEDSPEYPLVIDCHGPLLMETLFQENPTQEKLRADKIRALHKADFVTCASHKQRYYFQAWLMLAGFDLRQSVIDVIPVSLSPDLPAHDSQGETTFVYGGVFLPWQDPVSGLTTLVDCLERANAGRLKFFGGKHPVVAVPTGRFETLIAHLQRSPRVEIQNTIPRDQLIRTYGQAHVAFDLMQRNAERELAFTTRTVEYLWCGLPVIYNNYAELADYIQRYRAGWTLDPTDTDALTHVIDDILAHPQRLDEYSQNAQRLVQEQLTWDRTIEPLDAFCRHPRKQAKGPALLPGTTSGHNQLTYLFKKLHFHLRHEGTSETMKRIWRKMVE